MMSTRGILKITVPIDGKLVYTQTDESRSEENHITFQHITPRRKFDQFGRETTNASDFFLSAAVYPTGVRAPPLADLQQKCGYQYRVDDDGPAPKILSLKKHKHNSDFSTEQKIVDSVQAVDMLTRLKPYHWDDVNGTGKIKNDVRDPCYFYKYCADERPLRYNTNSNLPRISASPRPWSVGESNPSKRMSTSSAKENRSNTPHLSTRVSIEHMGYQHIRKCRPFKPMSFKPVSEIDMKKPLLEVRHLSTRDQRSMLKGKDGCLFSQVKQCIRLMRNHDARKTRSVDRPLKAEVGRYRPFSTTMIRTPCLTPPTIAHFRDHNSADTYKQYVEIQTLKSKLPTKSAGTLASGMFARNNTAASMYYDVDAHLVQAVSDSNVPPDVRKLNTSRKRSDFSLDGKTPNDQRNVDLDIVGTPIASSKPRLTDLEVERDIARKSVCSRVPEGSLKSSDQLDVPIDPYLDDETVSEVVAPSILLDELGNPTIWDQSDDEEEEVVEEDPNVIKIPAASVASILSVDEGENIVDFENVVEDEHIVVKEEKGC